MELMTEELQEKLLGNWGHPDNETKPALKIFSPMGAATWLIHSMDPQDHNLLYGLCDLGQVSPELGQVSPELGQVSLSELQEIRIPLQAMPGVTLEHLGLERDLYFEPQNTMAVYTEAARWNGRITEEQEHLEAAAQRMATLPGPVD